MSKPSSIWIGFDPKESAAFAVAKSSAKRHLSSPVPIRGLVLARLREAGLYRREHEVRDGVVWDKISEAPMSTEFAISRFLVPHVAGLGIPQGFRGWALFMDCDMLVRHNMGPLLFSLPKNDFAVMCVKHEYVGTSQTKMNGQVQTYYARKNWSSVMLFNLDHEANKKLTVEMVNTVPGRDLHAFCWLKDKHIGELPMEWNWLAGVSPPLDDPKIVHHTLGSPCMKGFESAPFADEWREELHRWAN